MMGVCAKGMEGIGSLAPAGRCSKGEETVRITEVRRGNTGVSERL
jgi:hypothetical protein